jgi:hypothetical protein
MSDVYVYITMNLNEDISDVNEDSGVIAAAQQDLTDALSQFGTEIVVRRTVGGVE